MHQTMIIENVLQRETKGAKFDYMRKDNWDRVMTASFKKQKSNLIEEDQDLI